MTLTLTLSIVIGALTAFGAALAGYLAAQRKWHKWAFWGTGVIAVGLISWQTHLNETAQRDLTTKIDDIRTNTQVALLTNLELLPPFAVTADPYFPFRAGQRPEVGVMYVNSGPQAASNTLLSIGLSVVRNPLSEQSERDVWNKSSLHGNATAGGVLPPHSRGRYNTVLADELSASEAKDLMAGGLQLCATARVVWTDKTGGYCRYAFQCFRREAGGEEQAFFNWHTQGLDYNREEACKIEGLHH